MRYRGNLQQGFASVGVVLAVLAVLVVVGGGAYVVVQKGAPPEPAALENGGVETLPEEEQQEKNKQETETSESPAAPSADTPSSTVSWSTAELECSIEDGGLAPVMLTYPTEIGVDEDGKCAPPDPGVPWLLPLDNGSYERYPVYHGVPSPELEVVTRAELHDDASIIFYLKASVDMPAYKTTFSLHAADPKRREVRRIDSFTVTGVYLPEGGSNLYEAIADMWLIEPNKDGAFVGYNWFTADPTAGGGRPSVSEFMQGHIAALWDDSPPFVIPCDMRVSRGAFGNNYDTADNGEHIVFMCEDGVYISDWINTTKVRHVTGGRPGTHIFDGGVNRVYFLDNERIAFMRSETLADEPWCLNVEYAMDLDGGNFKKTGKEYKCGGI